MSNRAKKRSLVLAVVLVCVALVGALGARTFAGALTNERCSVTVTKQLADGTVAAKGVTLTAHLYQVADWDPAETFVAVEPFGTSVAGEELDYSVMADKVTATTWETLANEAKKIVEAKAEAGSPVSGYDLQITDTVDGHVSDIPSGMYLLLVDTAKSEGTIYTYAPMLVTVGKGYLSSTATTTDPIVRLSKVTEMPRVASLTITKDLDVYNGTAGTVPFVFEVEAKDDNGTVVYSNVATLFFSEHGTQSVTLKDIPAYTTVRVTEVYSGAAYKATSSETVTLTKQQISADDEENYQPAKAEFTNAPGDTYKGGHGVENSFKYEGDTSVSNVSNYSWTQRDGNTASASESVASKPSIVNGTED